MGQRKKHTFPTPRTGFAAFLGEKHTSDPVLGEKVCFYTFTIFLNFSRRSPFCYVSGGAHYFYQIESFYLAIEKCILFRVQKSSGMHFSNRMHTETVFPQKKCALKIRSRRSPFCYVSGGAHYFYQIESFYLAIEKCILFRVQKSSGMHFSNRMHTEDAFPP